MNLGIENIMLIGAILLLASVIAGKASSRYGIPTLILFLVVGMLAGSEGILKIKFNDPHIAKFIGIVCLNFILFSGGLETKWQAIRPVFWQGVTLSTLGVVITALTTGLFVSLITDFNIYEGLLLGAIVSSTDAAAVFSILRSRNMALKNNLRPLLELESGSNDPVANLLTIAFLSLVANPHQETSVLINFFLKEVIMGVFCGFIFGYLSKTLINRLKIDLEGLYFVLVISLIFLTYSLTSLIHGNGFLAVYLCAVYLGNQELMHKKSIIKTFDAFAWLMQIILFLALGLLVFPSHILQVSLLGMAISLFLIFVARPLSVFIGLAPFKMQLKSKVYVSWVGLRGAVPIVFATYPLIEGIDKAGIIFNIVFFISVTSVLVQGGLLGKMAKWLKVGHPSSNKSYSPVELFLNDYAKTRMVEIELPPDSYAVGKQIIDLQFPENSIIAMINRKSKFFTPNGSSLLEAHDILIVLADNQKGITKVYNCLDIDEPETNDA
ncbi:MAG: potassium/proton antiporter [Bacteroidales bacterium]|jgi:cell volume regulation protein A|nr:potassium/proton antiporter [Bacteroidales bacterium]